MSGDGIVSGPDSGEEGTATDEEQPSNRCFQVSALCCCIPRRRISLPERRPTERKKKNAGGFSFSDIMLEEEMDRACWDVSVGDQETIQIEAIKPTPPRHPKARFVKDHSIPLPIGTSFLEEKQKNYDEKPVAKLCYKKGKGTGSSKEDLDEWSVKGKATGSSKEELDEWSVLSSETENKSSVAAASEGLPFEKETSYQIIVDKGNSQTGRPELLGTFLQVVAHEKEQQEGGNHASMISEGVSCKMAREKQEQQAVPFQELQPSGKVEDLRSPLPDTEIKMQEDQNSTLSDYEGAMSLTELLIQPPIPHSEEQQSLGQQQLAKNVAHKVSKEDIHKKVQGSPDTFYQEVWQSVELKCPESAAIMDKNYDQEQSKVLHRLDLVSEASHSETEHNYRKNVDKEVQRPILRKAMSYSFQDTTYKKEQEEGSMNSTSDSPVSKAGERQWIPHQAVVQEWIPGQWLPPNQDAAEENKTTFPLFVTCATEQQKPTHVKNVLEDGVVDIIPQKNLEKQHILLAEHVSSTHHGRISPEKEPQEGLDNSSSGSQGIAFTEDKENPELFLSENMGTLLDNISYEKEQQRKLECGDSGSESLYDKEEQDYQPAIYLEGQPPLVLEQLSSGLLNSTSEMYPLEEQPVEYADQSKKLPSMSSKEKEAEDDQEELITMFSSAQWNTQGEQMEARHIPKDTFIPHKEQLQKELIDLGMTCEEHQKKAKQGLSETGFSCSTRSDEEDI